MGVNDIKKDTRSFIQEVQKIQEILDGVNR